MLWVTRLSGFFSAAMVDGGAGLLRRVHARRIHAPPPLPPPVRAPFLWPPPRARLLAEI